MKKTERIYGAVYCAVRAFAAHGAPFTASMVPGITRQQARAALQKLVACGELVCLRKGRQRPGNAALRPAWYSKPW